MAKSVKYLLFSLIFSLAFFVPRYFAHLQYDALEDEILAIDFNTGFSTFDLFFLVPDLTHPPLWYILMDYPTSILGLNHGIFYYRLIQVFSLFFLIIFTLIYFYKKLPNSFLFTFFALFLSNIYLVHLTFQHRMYSMVLGISIFYSFYWYNLIKNDKNFNFKHFILLGLIAALAFFINYSAIWIIPIWPLAYIFYKKNLYALKRLAVFSSTFLISISWFVPTFIKNVLKTSSIANEYYLNFNFNNLLKLFSNYFGIIPTLAPTTNNIIAIPYILLLFLILFSFNKKKKESFQKQAIALTFFSFLTFLIFGIFNDFKLLVSRASITIVIAFYVLIADSLNRFKYSKHIIYLLIFFQLTQFAIYFSKDLITSYVYNSYNYRKHPMHFFYDYNFLSDSCLITLPIWNEFSAKYYIGDRVKVLSIERLWEDLTSYQPTCKSIYVLDQTTVDRVVVYMQFKQIEDHGYKMFKLLSNKNQILYTLEQL